MKHYCVVDPTGKQFWVFSTPESMMDFLDENIEIPMLAYDVSEDGDTVKALENLGYERGNS